MRTSTLSAVFAVASLVNVPAISAQQLFVQGGYGPDVRRFSAERGEEVLDGQAPNLSIGLAGFVTPRVTAGVELDLGGTASRSRTVTVTLAGQPTPITTTYAVQRRTLSALAGIHTSATRRARFSCYAGLAFNWIRREIDSDAPPIVLTEPPGPSVFLDRTTAPLVGADVAVTIVPQLAVVATLRAQGLSLAGDATGFSFRPGAAVRLVF